jgi:ferritin-like metal-binding protein YciE
MGMIMLFLTFSNHLSRLEIIHIIEKKLEGLKHKLEKATDIGKENKIRDLSLKALKNFRESEIAIYEELLLYAREHDTWNDFLVLKDKWEYTV